MRVMKGIDLKEQMGIPVFVPAHSTLPHHRVWEKPNQVVVTVQKPPPPPTTTGNDDDGNDRLAGQQAG